MEKFKGLLFLVFLLTIVQSTLAGDLQTFIDETIKGMEDNTVVTDGVVRTLDLQGRRYYIGGRLNYRVSNEVIQPITFTPPSISAGCGGINISLGALSYLKFDELVDKLQNALRASPALAVQLVISNLCEKCAAVLSFLEQVSDIINGLNMDSCSLAKAGVGFAAKKMGLLTEKNSGTSAHEDAKSWLKSVQGAFESVVPQSIQEFGKEIVKGFQSGVNSYDCAVITDPKQRAQCFNKMANSLGDISHGVIHEVVSLTGAGDNTVYENMEDVLRGFLGDFKVNAADGTGKVEYIPPEAKALHSLSIAQDDLQNYNLTFYPKKIDGTLEPEITLANFIGDRKNLLLDAYSRLKAGSDLTAQQQNLLGSLPIPLLAYFNSLRRLEYVDPQAETELSQEIIESVATYYGNITYLNALYQAASYIYYNINKIKASVSNTEGSEDVLPNLDSFKENAFNLLQRIGKIRNLLHKDMGKKSEEFFNLVKTAEKKVFMELYKYQYSSTYNFANRQ